MRPDLKTLEIITGWVTRLVEVTAHRDAKPGKDAIAAYAAILGQTFPSGAFTVESLAAVTDAREWFPAVSATAKTLDQWWQQHRPRGMQITDDRAKPQGWDDWDKRWVDFWFRRLPEIAALPDHRQQEFRRTRLESLIQAHAPRAWQYLSATSREAA